MRRSFWLVLAAILIGALAIGVLSARRVPARVLATTEHIQVMPATGQWYHDYSVLVGVVETGFRASAIDTVTLTVGRNQFDATPVGAHVRLHRLAPYRRAVWISDTNSAWQTFAQLIEARIKSYAAPAAISPLQVQTAGLARVVAVHSVQRPTSFWKKSEGASSDRSRWIHLVEVEFWALRIRRLVRTIDVIDAGSIPGLHPGDIVQMHFDQRDPRVMRLDDGMRTFETQGR